MDYGKEISHELSAQLVAARSRQDRARKAVEDAQMTYGIWMADRPAHPAVLRAFARFEAAELAAEGIARIHRDWHEADGPSVGWLATCAVIEGREVAGY